MIQDAQRRGNIIQTSKNTYKASAMKILKSRPFPHSGMATLERAAQEAPATLGGAKPQPLPSPDTTQRPPVSLPTPAGKRTPQETPNHRPPPVAQVKPIQEKPQDPRLVRRTESALKATGCKEGQTPASGPWPMQKPLTAQSRSNSMDTLGETPSCVKPTPSRAPSPVILNRRPPFLNEQFKTLKDRPNYPRRTLEVSREKDDSTEPKKRRTTF